MDFWWEFFNRTGILDAYIIYKEEEREKEDGARKNNGDSDTLDNGGRLQ